ncbi:MAG: HAMP domain-containing histidine kinase [Chloroflexi bacterium]|nr:HAMP domain-containing histidine kinase [Chloroflexota bacterium]
MKSDKNSRGALLQRYLSLLEISRDLSSVLDLDVLLHRIVNAAAAVTGSTAASILLYDESKHELYFQASTNLDTPLMKGLIVPVEGSIAGAIVTQREPLIVQNTREDPRHFAGIGKSTQFETESLLGVPLLAKDKVVGVLEALNKREVDFTDDDQTLLLALGSQAAIAIENARLFQQSDLIAEMVHEIRTPLASINTATHLLLHKNLDGQQRSRMAETIQRETQRLSELATTFLDLARLESGRNQFKIEPVEIPAVLDDARQVMSARMEEQRLALVWLVEEAVPIVQGDTDKLKQVALNLISNAIKYNSKNGSITIGCGHDKEKVYFYVEDTGRGMLPEHIDSLFEKFYRIPGSETVAEGTGLGLSICKKIVEAHGGSIEVKSTLGKGTRFTVKLPRGPIPE